MDNKAKVNVDAEKVAIQALFFLAADEGRLGRFLAVTGLVPLTFALPHVNRAFLQACSNTLRRTNRPCWRFRRKQASRRNT